MYSTTQQAGRGGGACGWQPVRQWLCVRVAWARIMMQTADVDGQSGQARPAGLAGRQGRKTGVREKRCVWEPGPSEWAPCGIVQEGGCHSGDV